jgi:hypothetical protein
MQHLILGRVDLHALGQKWVYLDRGDTNTVAFATATSSWTFTWLCLWKLTSHVIPASLQTKRVWPSTIRIFVGEFDTSAH